jgi:hypothetical protein
MMEAWCCDDDDNDDGGECAASCRTESMRYPALSAGYTIRGLVSATFLRKARCMCMAMGFLPAPQPVARSSGSDTCGARRRSAR